LSAHKKRNTNEGDVWENGQEYGTHAHTLKKKYLDTVAYIVN
jgi:hypothetical protein